MKNVPKLRFKEFFGEWKVSKLGTETTWSSGGTPSKQIESYWGGEIPWISASSMRGTRYSDSDLRITELGVSSSKLAVKGDLLLLVRGSMLFNKIPVGIATRSLAFNQDVKSITPKKSITSEFLLNWFSASENKIMNMVSGTGIGAGKLDTPDMLDMNLHIPSIQEQTKIADFLTAIDDRISQLSQKCDGLAQYKKGVMQKIFSQELRFKDEKGRAFPAWDAMELNRIGSTFNGLTGKSGDDFGDGESYITYKQIFSDRIVDIAKFSKVKVNEGEKQNKVKYGDIFFTISSETPEEVGFHSVLLSEIENVYLNSFCFGFRINSFDVVIPIFAYYMFGSAEFRREVIKLAQGSTRYNISKTAFMEIKVKMPSPPEQEKIAGFLSAVDEKISQVQAQLDALKQYKQGLLQQMFV